MNLEGMMKPLQLGMRIEACKKKYECYHVPDDLGCRCEWIETGVDDDKVCMLTSDYPLPGLKGKINVHQVCGYDLTESEECKDGALSGERPEMLFRVGRYIYLTCEHGLALNEVDFHNFPYFVDVCKMQLITHEKDEDGEITNSFHTYGGMNSAHGNDEDPNSWSADKCKPDELEEELKKPESQRTYGGLGPYHYYLCRDNKGFPKCKVDDNDWRLHSADGGTPPYRLVYKHPGIVRIINPNEDPEEPERGGNFCEG